MAVFGGFLLRKWRKNGWEWIELQFKWSKIAKIDRNGAIFLINYTSSGRAMVEKWILCSFSLIFAKFTPFLPHFTSFFSQLDSISPHFFLKFPHFYLICASFFSHFQLIFNSISLILTRFRLKIDEFTIKISRISAPPTHHCPFSPFLLIFPPGCSHCHLTLPPWSCS
jgi:hypothetical protein